MMKIFKILFLCRWVRSRLLQYFGGEVSLDDNQEIEKHLNTCSHCSQYSQKLGSVNDLVLECMSNDKSVPPTLMENVMKRVRADQPAE